MGRTCCSLVPTLGPQSKNLASVASGPLQLRPVYLGSIRVKRGTRPIYLLSLRFQQAECPADTYSNSSAPRAHKGKHGPTAKARIPVTGVYTCRAAVGFIWCCSIEETAWHPASPSGCARKHRWSSKPVGTITRRRHRDSSWTREHWSHWVIGTSLASAS
ncbi:hypothetical protein GY45DRAFT_355542 [Cubamyces sp. BRFM 1775]|nr:hypothetical protein GY45DRAFT_355542 [Cubamyces sp. BRFM 1775]